MREKWQLVETVEPTVTAVVRLQYGTGVDGR